MRNIIITVLLCLPLNVVLAHSSNTYTVQIGTYKNDPPQDLLHKAEQFGPIHRIWFNKITRVTVGEFSQKADAEAKLKQIQNAGFADAFIRKVGTAPEHSDHNHLEIQKFNLLAQKLNARSLYLGGTMYLKQGNRYIKVPW